MSEITEDRKVDAAEDKEEKTGRLAEESIGYFKRVEQVLTENTFEDDNHKEAFVRNVFHQIEDDGMQLTRHPITSRVLEQIIPLLTDKQYEKITELLMVDGEVLCCDRFGSHVVELYCKQIQNHISNEETVENFLLFCKSIKKHVDSFLRDTFGSHVLSTLLQVLSGVNVPELVTKSRMSRESKKMQKKGKKKKYNNSNQNQNNLNLKDDVTIVDVPEDLKKMYKRFLKAIKDDDNFGELLCHRTASPVLQVLLITLGRTSSSKFLILSQLIVSKARIEMTENEYAEEQEEDEETMHKLPVVLTDQVGSHLFEVLLQTADEETFTKLCMKCMKKMVASLSIHPIANFLVQTLLRCVTSLEQAEPLVKKLINFTEDILATGHMGCIVRVAEVIARLEMKDEQKEFVKTLIQSLHIPSEKEAVVEKSLAKLIISMMTYDVYYKIDTEEEANGKDDKEEDGENSDNEETEKVKENTKKEVVEVKLENDMINYHGACLLKSCLSFEKSRTVYRSFVSMTKEELLVVACHPSGCFAFEGFLKNQYIKPKEKDQLTKKLKGSLAMMACDKFGSRVIDSMWPAVRSSAQEIIREELTSNKSRLESDLYGRIVLCNCGISQQARRMKEIKERQEKKRKIFADILETKKNKNEDEDEVETVEEEITVQQQQPPVKKSKNNNDRAAKYREQLKALGINFNDAETTT